MVEKIKESRSNLKKLIITIDGPAGSGKSTTARSIANRLEYLYLDTGAMYRAVTLKVIRRGLKESQKSKVVELLADTDVKLKRNGNVLLVLLDGEDVSKQIRSPEVDREISWVCQIPEVRDRLVSLQRKLGQNGGIVAEGRDMGTVVFPDADLKFYLVASIGERARRRLLDMKKSGVDVSVEDVKIELIRRDTIDSERKLSPLRKAENAIEIDTTNLSIEQQTDYIYQIIQQYLYQNI